MEKAPVFKVFIVVDFEPLRVGLASAISDSLDIEVIGSAGTLDEMVASGSFHLADVIIVDAQAMGLSDMPTVRVRLAEWMPQIKVLFLATQEEANNLSPDALPAYLALGAIGLLYKTGDTTRLADAIRLVASGGFVSETDFIKRILTRLSDWASLRAEENNNQGLSERETEVLTLVARGRSNKEIALELFVSEGTVKAHISHIMSKIGAERRTELVRYALTSGLVQLPDAG